MGIDLGSWSQCELRLPLPPVRQEGAQDGEGGLKDGSMSSGGLGGRIVPRCSQASPHTGPLL